MQQLLSQEYTMEGEWGSFVLETSDKQLLSRVMKVNQEGYVTLALEDSNMSSRPSRARVRTCL